MKRTRISKALIPVKPRYIARVRKESLDIPEDPTVQLMGMLGLSYKAIQKETGLSNYHIAKRLKQAGVKLKAYRDNETPISKQVVHRIGYLAEKRIVDHFEKYLLK